MPTMLTDCSDDPKIPIHLLIYAVQTALTTTTCIADYMSWTSYTSAQKMEIGKLYVPYLALCKFFFSQSSLFMSSDSVSLAPSTSRLNTRGSKSGAVLTVFIAVFMGVDMFGRLCKVVSANASSAAGKKKL